MYNTGENEQGLRKIMDLTRICSLVVLALHFYYFLYGSFKIWSLTTTLTDRLLANIAHTGLFSHTYTSKLLTLSLLAISLIGVRGKKDQAVQKRRILWGMSVGVVLFFSSTLILSLSASPEFVSTAYIVITTSGYLIVLTSGSRLSRLIRISLSEDIFNEEGETFPQHEMMIDNPYSINLAARYRLKGKVRFSWVNIINPFRGLLVAGTPGSGKTFLVIRQVIRQHLQKGFALFVYDFKYDDLTRYTYECLQQSLSSYPIKPNFYIINFDDLSHSHRCNPLDPATMQDITDATESARTILLGLNREWIHKQGDFFVESPINFVTAIIWFLKKYEEGKYCTLPHVIELMQADYDELFPVLNTIPEIEVLVNPFISAYQNDAMEQLEGQVASAKIGMARLASPQLYWVLTGNDFTLDINNPLHPKIVCMGNNPERQQVYGAVFSLYISRMTRLVNKKDRIKCSLVFDEFPTIYFNHIDSLLATARSNRVATTIGLQDFSQLKKDYGRDQAEVILNICGNIISGQVVGETAHGLSERFGKIMQQRESVSINRADTSISQSMQLDHAIPASKIAALSSGEFVGMVADDLQEKIKLKKFHAEIVSSNEINGAHSKNSTFLPFVRKVSEEDIQDNFQQIKFDVRDLIEKEVSKLKDEREEQGS